MTFCFHLSFPTKAREIFLGTGMFFLCLSSWGQTTWELEETTLVEYDLVTGISIPWEILWGPDDMLWCTTRTGDVHRIDPATGAYTTVLDINVYGGNGSEAGLLGMAMHPDWDNTPEVFLAYCTGNWNNGSERLSKFTWDGENLVNEQVLHTVNAGGIHNGSRLLVLPDNTLLMTTGDAGDGGQSSQSDNSDNGKVLRFNLDGSVPSNNPDPNSYVYSKGHRNSQGLCLGPNGLIYSSEHGQNNWDEFNIIEMGRNYGWPNVEGPCNTLGEQAFCAENDVMEPLKTWSPCAAVNGIEFYDHQGIPEWQGSVLMAVLGGFALNDKRLSVLHMSEDGLSIESEDQFFSSFNQRVRDVAVHPETGAVYLAFNGPIYPGSGPNVIKEFRPLATSHIEEWSSARGLDLFPNPSNGLVRCNISAEWHQVPAVVWSPEGKHVWEGQLSNALTWDVSTWEAGMYFLTSTNADGKTMSRTLVVQ